MSIGRISADGGGAPGWRYLWEQVSEGAEDYYSADVARGEAAGRWGGSAAEAELGLTAVVTEEQMERVFGRLMHPTSNQVLGRGPTQFRSVANRLAAAEETHRERWTASWTTRETQLLEAGASAEQIGAEFDGHRQQAGERWAEVAAGIRRAGDRVAVAAFDLTFSPPKSVSVLWAAADPAGREIIWAAHRAGVIAALAYIEREAAWSRAGHNGVRQVGSSGMVIASFDHRMSRRGDVQIHTHNAVLNRVRCDDGEWRALDGRALYRVAASAGALYDRVRETCLERDLGVRHEQRKPSGPREIVGVDDEICRLFSSRRVQVEGRLAEMVATYTADHGAAPSEWMTARMSRWATLETRRAKTGTETTTEALTRWETETRAQLARSLSGVWHQATQRAPGPVAETADWLSDDEALVAAVAAVDAEKATWTRYDLARKLAQTITVVPGTDPDELLARIDALVDRALNLPVAGVVGLDPPPVFTTPARLRRRGDGQSVFGQHGVERFSTDAGVGSELRILTAAQCLDGPRLDPGDVDWGLGGLGVDQADATRLVLTSGRRVEALVGPAGTGKTHTMAAVARLWREGGGRVLGLAMAENAARTLSHAAGIDTLNVAKLLFEHAQRKAAQQADASWRARYGIEAGALVILDEAGMASRQVIDDLARLCQTADAKLLLVGDPQQLSSPEAGGAFRLVVDQVGAAHLGQVHRFAQDWERQASLRLRDGDVTVLSDYDLRARIVGGSEAEMEDAAFAAAMADRVMGRQTFLLADTNEQAARLAGRVRDQLVAAGLVDDAVTVSLGDGNRAGVGDRVVTRRNDRTNDSGGRFVANRDVWQITHLHHDEGVTVARVDPDTDAVLADQQLRLDAGYVAVHVQLEYAGTVHAAQGATGTVAHAIISHRSTGHGVYVALTRGIEENRAYVICERPEGADAHGTPQDPLALLAHILDGDQDIDDLSALATRDHLAERAVSLATLFPIWQDITNRANQQRWQRAVARSVGEPTAAAMLAAEAWPTLAARLRLIDAAGIDSAAALTAAATADTLIGIEDVAAVLCWRLRHNETGATAIDTTFTTTPPTSDAKLDTVIAQIATAMDARTRTLGQRTYTAMPDWVTELGARPHPADTVAGDEWKRRAGIVAGYREAFHLDRHGNGDDRADPIGATPPPTRPDATLWWQRAAAALGRTGPADLADLDDEHLHAIIERARHAAAGAPCPVDGQLRSVSAELRAARTVHGQTLAGGIPPNLTAAAHTDALIAQVAELEHGRLRRQQWWTANASLQAQSDAATAELAARSEARTNWPHPDTDTDTLRNELARTQQRLAAATTVAEHHETAGRRSQQRVDDLTAELAALTTHQLDVRAAQGTVAAERAAAARVDDLRTAVTQTRLGRPVLGRDARRDAAAELAELVNTNPGLAVDSHRRQQRWATIVDRAQTATRRQIDQLTHQLNQTQTTVAEHADIATRARTEIDHQQQRHAALTAELHRRQPHTTIHDTPPEPHLDADTGHSQNASPGGAGTAATTLQAALAAVDQELTAAARVAQRHEALAGRWQHTADQLRAELARLNQQHPELTLANDTIAEQRATAHRIDQLRESLARRMLTLPALRGGHRQSATDELHQLINTNPALALDPTQREQRWTAMIDHATIAEQRQADHIAHQLAEINQTIHQNTSTVHRARTAIGHLTEQRNNLRAQLEPNPHNPTAGTTNTPKLTAGDATPNQSPLDTPTPSAVSPYPTEIPPLRHHQMQPATTAPTATEQLIVP